VESLLERSAFQQLADGSIVELDHASRELLSTKLHQLSSKALRCLGLAYKEDLGDFSDYDGEKHPAHMKLLEPTNYSDIESDLIFVGLVGLRVCSSIFMDLFIFSPPSSFPLGLW
jgi:Ca2+-transporting ATPase